LTTRILPGGDIAAFSPRLTLPRKDVGAIPERHERGLAKLMDRLRTEALWQGY